MISPVVSSAVCNDCRIEDLSKPVNITFDMTNEVTTSVVVIDNNVCILHRKVYLLVYSGTS